MTMSKKKILIIDGSNLAYRAYHSMSRMSYKGQGTAIQWGFLNILSGLLNRYNIGSIRVCWDGKGSNPKRLEVLPTYRQRQEDKKRLDFDAEEFFRQREATREILYTLGIPQLVSDYVEADDYIYHLAMKAYKNSKKQILIASGDKDFRQLVNNRIGIHDEKHGYITPYNFKKLFKIEPHQYADYLCLLGDSSDKIPGVRGVGEVTACKLLTQHGTIANYLASNPKDRLADPIREIYPINRYLINLAYFVEKTGSPKVEYYKAAKKPQKNIDDYFEICSIFGINKFKTLKFVNQIP